MAVTILEIEGLISRKGNKLVLLNNIS